MPIESRAQLICLVSVFGKTRHGKPKPKASTANEIQHMHTHIHTRHTKNKCEERMGQMQRIHIQTAISPAEMCTARTNPHENEANSIKRKGAAPSHTHITSTAILYVLSFCSFIHFLDAIGSDLILVLLLFLFTCGVRYELRAVNCASSRNV